MNVLYEISMYGSHREAWRRWCGDVLLVTHATTAFCIDSPSHLVCAYWEYNLFFNRIMTQHTPRLCQGVLTKNESDGVLYQMTWPPQSPDLNPIEMVLYELDRRVRGGYFE